MKENIFDIEIITKGSYMDRLEDGGLFKIEVITIRLNSVALNEWIFSEMFHTRECYETDQEWEQHRTDYQLRRKTITAKIVNALGIKIEEGEDGLSISQALSEVFTVVHIKKLIEKIY